MNIAHNPRSATLTQEPCTCANWQQNVFLGRSRSLESNFKNLKDRHSKCQLELHNSGAAQLPFRVRQAATWSPGFSNQSFHRSACRSSRLSSRDIGIAYTRPDVVETDYEDNGRDDFSNIYEWVMFHACWAITSSLPSYVHVSEYNAYGARSYSLFPCIVHALVDWSVMVPYSYSEHPMGYQRYKPTPHLPS